MSMLRPTGVPLHLARSIHTGRLRSKNVLARYSLPSAWPAELVKVSHEHDHDDGGRLGNEKAGKVNLPKDGNRTGIGKQDTFGSMATTPAIASIQDMPSPASISTTISAAHLTSGLNTDIPAGQTISSESLKKELSIPTQPVPAMTDPVIAASSKTSDGPTSRAPSTQDRTEPLTVAGVFIPVKPKPPGEEECCMSGCVNCIYTVYTDETLEYNQSIMDAISALSSSGVPRSAWPAEVREKAGKERLDRGGEVGIEGSREEVRKEVLKGLDPSLRAFLEMEAKLKAKKDKNKA